MRGNTNANHATYYNRGRLGTMEYFDRLPKAMREALRNADNNWSAAQLYLELRKPKAKRKPQLADMPTAIAFLREQDARYYRADYPDMLNTGD